MSLNTTTSPSPDLGALAVLSVKAVANVLLQFSIGIVLAYKGIITNNDVGGFSKAMNYVLVPCLSFSAIGANLSQELFLREGWILAVTGLLACYEFFFLAILVRPLVKPNARFGRLFAVMMALPNAVALPVEITTTFCRLGVFDSDFSSAGECREQALLYIFMYLAFNSLSIWVVFYNYLREGAKRVDQDEVDVEQGGKAPAKEPEDVSMCTKFFLNPLKYLAFQVCARPPVIASTAGLVVGLVPELQSLIFGVDAPLEPVGFAVSSLAQATVPIVNLVMAFSIGLKLKEMDSWRSIIGSKEVGAEPRAVISSVALRGIVLPAIHFGILIAIFPFLPDIRLFRFMLIVCSICPTASIVVVVAHIAGLGELAKTAAFVIIPQYILAIPGLIVFLSLALFVIG